MRRYLIVDDNREFAENLAEILRDRGDEATVAAGGEEALVAVGGNRFDAMLCDMRMPEMGGAQVVHKVRELDPGIPAVVITAYTSDNELTAARNEGLLAILPKPVPIARMLELLSLARRDGLVAIVEDDESLLDNLTEALRSRGFATVTARTVLEADRLRAIRPFAAIVDLRVPGGSDGEAALRLKARYAELPLFVITAHELPSELGASAVFHKPFDTARLLAAIEEHHRPMAKAASL